MCFLQFQFFQKADDNKKVVYTWSNTWVLRTHYATSNRGNNPRLSWSSNDLESHVSCKTVHQAVGNDSGLESFLILKPLSKVSHVYF